MKVRNDALKHNPSLRPFDELLETERQYDYNLALETLATLVTLGYQISSQVRVLTEHSRICNTLGAVSARHPISLCQLKKGSCKSP